MGGKPLPLLLDERSRTYWEAAGEGRLLLERCRACGRHQLYPRGHCTACFGAEVEWVEARGTGRLHTFSVVHRTSDPAFVGDVPYAIGIVELDEGPRLTAGIAGIPFEELACDLPVRLVFTAADGVALPKAAPGEP